MKELGKKRGAARLELRSRGGGAGRYVIMEGGRQVMSTGLGPDRTHDAETALDVYRNEKRNLPTRGSRVVAVPIVKVLDWAAVPVAALPPGDWRAKLKGRSRLSTLRRHWAGKLVGDITNTSKVGRGSIEGYIEARKMEPIARPGGSSLLVSEGGAVGEVNLLRTLIREYAAVHSLHDIPRFNSGGRFEPRVNNALTRDQVAALLRTCLGYSRDGTNGRWTRNGAHWRSKRTKRAHIARFILLSVYTGSTERCLRALRWLPADGGGVSFVGPEDDPLRLPTEQGGKSLVDPKDDLLHRLGADASAGRMACVPIRLPRRLLSHLARWRKIDGKASRPELIIHHVLHAHGGIDVASPLSAAFTRIRKEAGLPDGVTARDLSYTTGVWIMRAGTGRALPLPRRRTFVPATLRSAAFFCGMTYVAFRRMYAIHKPGHMAAQHRALERPVSSVR